MTDVLTAQTPRLEAVRPALIELVGVEKVYRTGKLEYPALRGIDLTIADGDMVAIVGPSGSGKSTIMNMITGIDRPTAGTVTVGGERIDAMSEEELAIWRGRHVGVVFQFFQLLPTLSALENATLPLDFARRGSRPERRERALHNLELVGLADRADYLPSELSGGQQQRVAIARALASHPTLVIGDEPTGNLDTKTAAEMFELLNASARRARPSSTSRTTWSSRHARTGWSRSATVASWTGEGAVMYSTPVRKSITDLTRRKARASFTVLTLALAVASIGVFGVPAVMEQAMDREVAANRLADVTLTMKPLRLTARDLAALERLPNVVAVEPRTTFATRVYVGSRRDEAMLIGVPDFGAQQTDVVAVAKGAPRAGSVLVEAANVRSGDFKGSVAKIVTADRVGAHAADQRPGPHPGRILRVGLPDLLRARADRRVDRGVRRLHVARPAAERRQSSAPPSDRRGRSRPAARDDRLHRVRRPAHHPRAGELPRQGGVRVDGEHPQRGLAARADLRARAALQHDDDADRRADRRDRRHEGDRRPPPRHPAHLPAHRRHVRRPWLGARRRARDRDLEPRGQVLRAAVLRHPRRVRRLGPADPRRPARRARRPAARGAARRAPRRAPSAQRGAASVRLGSRGSGSARFAAAARPWAAAAGPDRAAQRRAAQAPHGRDGAAGRPRGRDLPRAAVARLRGGGVHARVVRRQPLRHLDPAAGRQGARLRHRSRDHRRRGRQGRTTVAEQRREGRRPPRPTPGGCRHGR